MPESPRVAEKDAPEVSLTEDERRELAHTFHGVLWLSPERAACVERIIAARLAAVAAEAYQRGYDDGCDDPESMWTSTKQAYRDQGAAEVRTRVEALCNAAERHADTYKRACIVTTGQVRDALETRPIPPGVSDRHEHGGGAA